VTAAVAIYPLKENAVLILRRWRLGTATLDELGAAVDALNAELAKRPSGSAPEEVA